MKKQIGIYSALHFCVDFLCAVSMFGSFIQSESGYLWILIYNFCAFALQMPFGILLDNCGGKGRKYPASVYMVFLGTAFTVLGMFTNPVILGIGNAMFHVGGGVGTIREDEAGGYHGAGLGVFVAPGALGLYIGTLSSKSGWYAQCQLAGIVSAGILILILVRGGQESRYSPGEIQKNKKTFKGKAPWLWLICFAVVVVRSYIGMAVTFPWKTTLTAGVVCTAAVVTGKIAGGFLASKIGVAKAAGYSLALAAVMYALSDIEAAGVLALFFFNMSMPMTLYLLVRECPKAAGFAFGLLTFGLFLGFLPVYLGIWNLPDGRLAGSAGSILSLILLNHRKLRSL